MTATPQKYKITVAATGIENDRSGHRHAKLPQRPQGYKITAAATGMENDRSGHRDRKKQKCLNDSPHIYIKKIGLRWGKKEK